MRNPLVSWRVSKHMEEEKVTGFPGIPTIFSTLLQMDLSSFRLSSLRYITNTAANFPPSHIESLSQNFPGVKIYSMYGLTETKRVLFMSPRDLGKRPDSVGKPIPGTEVWIEDDNGNRAENGEIGELVVRGRHVMRGYWGDEVATSERFRPGPIPGERICYTGDLFRMDGEGFYYFIGRKDDIFKCQGEKVAPKEIEQSLYMMPGIVEAAVIGIDDPLLGQAPLAFIVSNTPMTETAVLAYCQKNLDNYMVPKSVVFMDSLPKTPSGKIDKKKLMQGMEINS